LSTPAGSSTPLIRRHRVDDKVEVAPADLLGVRQDRFLAKAEPSGIARLRAFSVAT
jgi:hypothetical protein